VLTLPPTTEPEPASPGAVLDATAAAAARPRRRPRLRRPAGDDLLALLPGALLLFFAFQAGGYFAGATGLAAGALAALLTLRATLARRPFAPVGAPVVAAMSALAGLAAWQLLSATWSHATARALLEFDRTLLYGLAFLLCATVAWTPRRLAWAVRSLAVACFAVALAGWLSRVAPDTFPTAVADARERLSFPLTYWNAQGLVAALGVVLALHLGCSAREPGWIRALGCAAVPLLASSQFLTLSRGALLAVAAGAAVYVLLYRSRGLLPGLLVALPAGAAAVKLTYDASLLTTRDNRTAEAIAQGHDVLVGVALCALAALVVRGALARWADGPLRRLPVPALVRAGAMPATVVALVLAAVALGAPGYLQKQYRGFMDNQTVASADQRERLLDPANTGRVDNWRVALDAYKSQPLHGTGAGTYETVWNREREIELKVTDGHSLYLEVLGELGVVGAALLALALLTIGGGVLWRGRRRRRARAIDPSADAVVVAVMAAWALQAGLDWMWELPAVTAPVFALGGIALAARVPAHGPAAPGRTVRVAIGLGCLALAVLPVQAARSQAQLDEGVRAFHASPRSCQRVIDASLASLESMPSRAEPWELLAYCDMGVGQPGLALQAVRNAVARDPGAWTYRYAQALVVGATGGDPRPAARRAFALNPRSELARKAVKRFEAAKRKRWPQVAHRLPLPTD
jgi:hypothetical protein